MMLHSDFEVLKANMPFFSCADETVRRALESELSHKCEYTRGEEVPIAAAQLGIVLRGSVKIKRGEVILGEKTRGGSFGYACLFGGDGVPTSLVASCDCRIIFLPSELLSDLMKSDFSLCENLLSVMGERIRFLNSKLASFTSPNACEKVWAQLSSFPKDEDGRCGGFSGLAELSRVCGVGRATLYRALDELEAMKKISRDGKNIYILR